MNVRTLLLVAACCFAGYARIGSEIALTRHFTEGDEFRLPTSKLLDHGRLLFNANWTDQKGGGRPLADPTQPLGGNRSFNRTSGPNAKSCAGCGGPMIFVIGMNIAGTASLLALVESVESGLSEVERR